MSYPTVATIGVAGGVTAVDCQKQVRSWRILRSLMELLIPSCNCTFVEDHRKSKQENYIHNYYFPQPTWFPSTTNITGTIFGYRRRKVYFCVQTNPKSTNPILLLELAVSTTILAREMREGNLRIALECNAIENGADSDSLLSMPVWTMYCNGRKVGFAVKRRPSKADMEVLRLLDSVVGAGIISKKELNRNDEIMYLRSKFERVRGSFDSESFHLIDPDVLVENYCCLYWYGQMSILPFLPPFFSVVL
ncbi:hypothetical protein F0562_003184 [Nyssa sinensis]|uniref:Protein MIZU-KUSSEI 1 n=1 Tax=Nyssa sinensis TaxID=561372 RepID=A0A5J5BUN7_9ASTE|nr:hypothetical protein F0562_003184 [Nyssa sinensis]